MRTLHDNLTAAQRSANSDPYDRVYLINAAGNITYTFTTADSPNRIVGIQHREECYGGVASIILDNSDGYFNAKNLKGYKVTIGWGYTCSDGNRYSDAPDLWVIGQVDKSVAGKVRTQLLCYDKWNMWSKSHVFAGGTKLTGAVTRSTTGDPYYSKLIGASSGAVGRVTFIGDGYVNVSGVTGTFTTETAATANGSLSIVITQVTTIGATAGGAAMWKGDTHIEDIVASLISDWCSVTIDSDDGSANFATYMPTYAVQIGTSIRSVVKEMFDFTECGGRIRSSGNLHIMYLDPAPASPDYSYALDTGSPLHSFLEETRDRRIVTPNRIFTMNYDPYAATPTYVGTATDTDSYGQLGKYLSEVIVMPSIGSQADADARASALINRAKASANTGETLVPMMNVGQELLDWVQITDNRSGDLVVSGRIGTIQRNFHIEGGEYAHSMSIILGNLETSADIDSAGEVIPAGSDIPTPGSGSTPETIPTSRLAPGAQAYICDLRFTSTDWDTVTWAACTLTLKSGNTQAINSGTKDFANDNPYYAYFIWGNSTLQWTQSYGNCIGEDRGLVGTCKRGTSSTDKAYAQNFFNDSILINRDKVMDNLVNELKLADEAVTNAKIAALAVTGGKIAALTITGTNIAALTIAADKIAANAVTADKIYAGSVTAVKIDAGAIDATKLAAEIVLATTIWAGANRVKLDSSGIQTWGATFKLYRSSGQYVADIYGSDTGDLILATATGGEIHITAGSAPILLSAGSSSFIVTGGLGIRPDTNNADYCGYSDRKWYYVYRTNESACELPTSNSALDVIRKMKPPKISDGEYGNRHYFKDDDMPTEIKFRPEKDKLPPDIKYEDTKEEIEFTRLMGVLTQAVRELTDKVDNIERRIK